MKTVSETEVTCPSIFLDHEWQAICRSLDLSDRQVQIASLVLQGYKTRCVSKALGISRDTVRAHLRRLYLKLGVSDRLSLMICVVREFRRLYPRLPCSPNG